MTQCVPLSGGMEAHYPLSEPTTLRLFQSAALVERNPGVDWAGLDDVIFGCANQAGEDNRNVGRMALLLAGLPEEIPGATVNRLCGSSLDAVAAAARAIRCGETELMIAGRRRKHVTRSVCSSEAGCCV